MKWLAIALLAFYTLHRLGLSLKFLHSQLDPAVQIKPKSFYSAIKEHSGLCSPDEDREREDNSFSGYIGLEGDDDENPRRSFFWLFQAQKNPLIAPLILTVGGGPGSSGFLNTFVGQSPCLITPNGTVVHNPNAWTEHFNLLVLNHPIGAGFSYGNIPNNSRSAAYDAYDFLQKFYTVFPKFASNRLTLSSGSYGGSYIPHIAAVIYERNLAILKGQGTPTTKLIDLDSIMLTNPYTDALSHWRWLLHQRCYNTNVYNATTCRNLYAQLPACLEGIQFAYENPSVSNRVAALDTCISLEFGERNGTVLENVTKKCFGKSIDCVPELKWITAWINNTVTREMLDIPDHVKYESNSREVLEAFKSWGDLIQPNHLLYEPLLKSGARLLHFVGFLDANCAWPGVFSFLKLIKSPFQEGFISAEDIPWPIEDVATVRVAGSGAGNMTYILVHNAGHFVILDQPEVSKKIAQRWIMNHPFVDISGAS
ncbi:alpha/beta-hydrolase [Abortiporus biennis]|nr:alpha/beta-hydrolase [Abortiporus biennis]